MRPPRNAGEYLDTAYNAYKSRNASMRPPRNAGEYHHERMRYVSRLIIASMRPPRNAGEYQGN